jgi:hypothetical protein
LFDDRRYEAGLCLCSRRDQQQMDKKSHCGLPVG